MKLSASLSLSLALALALPACSPPPTVSLLVILGDGTPAITDLARLRLIVRTCDNNQPALAQNLPIDSAPPTLQGPVVPGTSFYVWLQGWEPCNPPCIPEDQAPPNEDVCTCVGDTPQLFRYEACTDWLEANSDVRRTLTLAPKATPALCPPANLEEEECQSP